MRLTPDELVDQWVFPQKPFQRGNLALFWFYAVKENKFKLVKKLIELQRFIIYEYDLNRMTALHWAAQKNHNEIVKLLITSGAHINK